MISINSKFSSEDITKWFSQYTRLYPTPSKERRDFVREKLNFSISFFKILFRSNRTEKPEKEIYFLVEDIIRCLVNLSSQVRLRICVVLREQFRYFISVDELLGVNKVVPEHVEVITALFDCVDRVILNDMTSLILDCYLDNRFYAVEIDDAFVFSYVLVIGSGLSEFYRGFCSFNGVPLAFQKFIFYDDMRDLENVKENFLLEVLTVRNTISDKVVRITDTIEEDDHYFIITELCLGSLKDLIDSSGPFDYKTIKHLTRELLQCIYFLRTRDIYHRDIKSTNFLYVYDDFGVIRLKVSDFGWSKGVSEKNRHNTSWEISWRHMAPEILQEEQVEDNSDLYSIGVIIYQMIFSSLNISFQKILEIEDKVLCDFLFNVLQEVRNRMSWEDVMAGPIYADDMEEIDLVVFSENLRNKTESLKLHKRDLLTSRKERKNERDNLYLDHYYSQTNNKQKT